MPKKKDNNLLRWFKQLFCTHYYELMPNGLPLYVVFPKKKIWPPFSGLRIAKNDLEAHTCLNCGMKFFDTDGGDTLLSSRLEERIKGRIIL